jgi:hypothetical protein
MYPSYGLPTFPMLVPGFLGALAWLGASRRKVGSRPTLHSGVILHRGFLGALLCAALSHAQERPLIALTIRAAIGITRHA